jgi:hypothetical protein
MNQEPIDASPTKELFIDTLVRDVSVKDAILDLLDNAIDGYIRQNYTDRREIRMDITKNLFRIWDNCGGIDVDSARKEVFRFGIAKPNSIKTLGVYGIGLKRSIFKLGSYTVFESDDLRNYFRIIIDLNEWKDDPSWTFEFDELTKTKGTAFTQVSVSKLHDKIIGEFETNRFSNELYDRISKTYFLFIEEKVDIYLNSKKIEPLELTIGFSEDIQPAHKSINVNGVNVKLTAGAHPDYKNPGWFIFCNDRLIILEERTSLTGWGNRGVPIYHPKFNRFKGFAYIYSKDPKKLPWNTAKNGLDTSSPVYTAMLDEMQTMTQQYTAFMSRAYPTEKDETIGKDILGELETKSAHDITHDQMFIAPKIPDTPKYTTISYRRRKKEVNKLKQCMGKMYMSNRELGEKTFDYYKEMECSDEE